VNYSHRLSMLVRKSLLEQLVGMLIYAPERTRAEPCPGSGLSRWWLLFGRGNKDLNYSHRPSMLGRKSLLEQLVGMFMHAPERNRAEPCPGSGVSRWWLLFGRGSKDLNCRRRFGGVEPR
jgi:hypothetical protein